MLNKICTTLNNLNLDSGIIILYYDDKMSKQVQASNKPYQDKNILNKQITSIRMGKQTIIIFCVINEDPLIIKNESNKTINKKVDIKGEITRIYISKINKEKKLLVNRGKSKIIRISNGFKKVIVVYKFFSDGDIQTDSDFLIMLDFDLSLNEINEYLEQSDFPKICNCKIEYLNKIRPLFDLNELKKNDLLHNKIKNIFPTNKIFKEEKSIFDLIIFAEKNLITILKDKKTNKNNSKLIVFLYFGLSLFIIGLNSINTYFKKSNINLKK